MKIVKIITAIFCLFWGQFSWITSAESATPKTFDVIVVGGGIAGLTAAYYLDKYDVLLLEMQKEVGGRAASGQYRNLSFARGAEYLGKPEEPLSEIIDELGLKLRKIPSPADTIYHQGRFYYGEQGKARLLIDKSSFHDLGRFASKLGKLYDKYDEIPELDLQGELARLDAISAKQWFEENSFPKIFHEIYNVTARGLFGANLAEISALSALPELAFDVEGFDEADDGNELLDELGKISESSGMYTFDGGIAEIPLAMARDLADSIRTGAKVTSIIKTGELFEVRYIEDGKTEAAVQAEAVIITTPAPVALKIGVGVLDSQQKELLATVKYAPYNTIALLSDRPIFDKGFDLAVEDGKIFTDIYDASWVPRHFKPGSEAIENNWVTLVYSTPLSFEDTNFFQGTDQDILTKVFATLDDIFPGASASVTGHEITRFNYGLPVMTPGSYQRMITLDEISGNGVFLAGDYLIYPTFEAASASGQRAAEKVEEWLKD